MKYDHYLKRRNKYGVQFLTDYFCNLCIYERIRKHIGYKVLEIGPGQGFFTSWCYDMRRHYCFQEPNREIADKLVSCGHTLFGREYAPPIESRDNYFDFVYASYVLEHMKDDTQALEFMSEIKRVLKDGGKFALLVPDYNNWRQDFWDCDYTHTYPTNPSRMQQMIEDAGLKLVKIYNLYGYFRNMWILDQIVRLTMAPIRVMFPNNRIIRKISTLFHRNVLVIGKKE